MKHRRMKWSTLILMLGVILLLGACKKKVAPPPPPPPPPPPAPTATLSASPDSIQKGQSTTLTWQTSNATDVSIDGIGAVQASGSQSVSPSDSTTYHLTAKGAGGTQDATARVTVTQPPPPPPPAAGPTDEELFGQNVKDIYFDYDKYDIRAAEQAALQGDIAFLKDHPSIQFVVEGHCDERGCHGIQSGTGRQPRRGREERSGCRVELMPVASRPSATARSGRSAPSPTKNAGSRIVVATWRTRSKGELLRRGSKAGRSLMSRGNDLAQQF